MFTCSWQFHHCNILFLWQQIVASDLQRVQYQYIIQKCILLVTWIQSNDLSSKYFPHSSQVPQQQYMSFFRLNFLPLNQHTFWHFFMVILHYGLRPRRNLIFWTLHRFTNINCKICFYECSVTLNQTYYCTYMIQEFYMVNTLLYYRLYLAGILNHHSFVSCSPCSPCAFRWTLSTTMDR